MEKTTREGKAIVSPPKNKGGRPAKEKEAQYVTVDQFNKLTEVLGKIVDTVNEIKNKPASVPEAKEAEEVRKAKWDQAPINPAWEEKAIEIIGEAVDHCEIFYPKSGGTIFTVVIKTELSNAPQEYLDRAKSDRRSREIGPEGIAGVENWCKLIRANLKRGQVK